MKTNLSVLMITKNAEELLEKSLQSVQGLANEIIVVDDYSHDKTVKIAKKYGAKVYLHHEPDFGKQKRFAVEKASSDWILVIDADEQLSEGLKKEIAKLHNTPEVLKDGYYIPFQNHFLGHPLHYGGENYKKLLLFKRNKAIIKPALVHEHFELKKGKVGYLKNKIYHYSYRSLWQMYKKFSDYALREAKQKAQKGEKSSLKKIFLYPLHLFWARFVEDKGYKDGLFRLPLDLGFAYMEFLTYFLLLFKTRQRNFSNSKKAQDRISSANLVDSVTRDTSLLRGSAKIPQSASRRVTSLVTPTKFSEKITFVSSDREIL